MTDKILYGGHVNRNTAAAHAMVSILYHLMAAAAGATLLCTLIISARAAGPIYPDLAGHWSQQEVESAAQAGWVSGYPDGTFRPEAQVARAEFVKLLLAAVRLSPDSSAAAYLHQASKAAYSPVLPGDMADNWLTQAGWTQVAVDFGLIQASDIPDGQFAPTIPLTRGKAAVLIVRALGLVYPASQNGTDPLPFTDTQAIPGDLRGYALEAARAGVIQGLPDGSFGSDRPISRAEAVSMIGRALGWMEQGTDLDIQVYVKQPGSAGPGQPLALTVPAQVIDGTVYLPVRDVIRGNAELYGDSPEAQTWDPATQELRITLGLPCIFRPGDNRYVGYGYGELNDNAWTFPTQARLLYGEVMVPVYGPETNSQTNLWPEVQWDESDQTVTVFLYEQYAALS